MPDQDFIPLASSPDPDFIPIGKPAAKPKRPEPDPDFVPIVVPQGKQPTADPTFRPMESSESLNLTQPVPGMERLVKPGQAAQPPNNPLQAPVGNQPVPQQPVPGLNEPKESLLGKLVRGMAATAPSSMGPIQMVGQPRIQAPELSDIASQAKEQTLYSGPAKVISGTGKLLAQPGRAGKPGQRLEGATELASGINETLEAPAIVGGAISMAQAPVRTAAELAGWSMLPPVARKTAEVAGASPEVQELAGEAVATPFTGALVSGLSKPLGAKLLNTQIGRTSQAKFGPKLKPYQDTAKFWLTENLRSMDDDPALQSAIRRSTQETTRTLAKEQMIRDRPRINDAMREGGFEPEVFDHMHQYSRLTGKQQELQSEAQRIEQTPAKDFVAGKFADELPVKAKDLDENFQAGVEKKLEAIAADTGSVDEQFHRWRTENFEDAGNNLIKAGDGTVMTVGRARQIFDQRVETAVRSMAQQPGSTAPMSWAQFTPLALRGVRLQDMFARTYHGLAGAVRNARDRNVPITPDQFEQIRANPAFQKAASIYKWGKEPSQMQGVDLNDPTTIELLRKATSGEGDPALSSIEGLYRHNYKSMEHQEGGNLGPLDTYYPLLMGQEPGTKRTGPISIFKGRYTPFNPAGMYTTGLAKYTTDVNDLISHLGTMIYQGRKAEVVKNFAGRLGFEKDPVASLDATERKAFDAKLAESGKQRIFVEPDYFEKVDLPWSGPTKVKHSGQSYIVDFQLAKELQPFLERSRYAGHETHGQDPQFIAQSLLGDIIKVKLLGPSDNVSFLTRVVLALPTQASKLPSDNPFVQFSGPIRPLIEAFRGTYNAASIDPAATSTIRDLRTMIQEGALSPRFGRATTNKQLASDTGIEYAPNPIVSMGHNIGQAAKDIRNRQFSKEEYTNPVAWLDSMLYGPPESKNSLFGLDARVRMTLWRAHKQAFPSATPQERARFVNAIGNYNRTLQSHMERAIGSSPLGALFAPFIQTGSAFYRTGVHTALGARVLPRLQAPTVSGYLQSQIQTGAAAYLSTWAGINYAMNGQFPWDDPQGAKVGAVKLPPALVSKLRPWLGDQDGKPLYVDTARWAYLFSDKGLAALGIRGGLNEVMTQNRGITGPPGLANLAREIKASLVANDGKTMQVFFNGFGKDMLNTVSGPLGQGPLTGAVFGAAGRAPYVTKMNGPLPEFLDVRKPASSAVRELANVPGRAIAGAADLSFPAEALGIQKDTDRLDKSKMGFWGSLGYSAMPPMLKPYVSSPEKATKGALQKARGLTRKGEKTEAQDRERALERR